MNSPPVTGAASVHIVAAGARWSRRLVIVAAVLSVAATSLPAAAQDVFVLVVVTAGLLAGLPHGSVDHRLAAGLTGWSMPVVSVAYAAAAALTWVLLSTTGLVALVPILLLSLAHFALGELEVLRVITGWRPSRAVSAAVAMAGTGALLLPLARSGAQLAEVANSISPQLADLLSAWPGRLGLAAIWVLAAALAVVAAVRAGQYVVVLDIAIVGALGVLAPPLVAFAVWFGGWHALRHCARLLTVDARSATLIASGHPRRAVVELARIAVAPTLAAVVVLVGLLLVTVTSADPAGSVGATVVVLLALTVPHMLVVLWVDHRHVPECNA